MIRALVGLIVAAAVALDFAVLAQAPAPATAPAPAPPPAAAAAPREPTVAELKAAVFRLQAQVLERDRELGQVKARLAELELAALARAIDTLDPDVRALLGVPATPAPTPAPAPAGPRPPR